MRRFLPRLLAFGLLQVAIGIAVSLPWLCGTSAAGSYLDSALDKHALALARPVPPVMLAGGSNMAFGVDSPALEAALGRRVVNLGLHAHVGVAYLCDEIRLLARPGSTVVLGLEYELWVHSAVSTHASALRDRLDTAPPPFDLAAWQARADRWHLEAGAELRDAWQGLLSGRADVTQLYRRDSFNAHGDHVGHHGVPRRPFDWTTSPAIALDRHALEATMARVVRLQADMRARGARLFLLMPPYPRPMVVRHRVAIDAVATALRGEPQLLVIDDADAAAEDPSAFYDTAYHLRAAGATRRAVRLAAALRDHGVAVH